MKMPSWPTQRKIMIALVLVSGIHIMFPTLELLNTIYNFQIIEFITPGFLIGAIITYFAVLALRGRA
jgi:hypothetical protein